MKTVRIAGKVLQEMVEHARREYPLECCGLLSGSGWNIDGIRATGNQRQSREEFFVPVEELFAFFRGLRRSGKEHLGIYHSHPTSRSRPSSRDVAQFHYPDVSYWIVSLKEAEPDVRCFCWDQRDFKNVDFEVYGSASQDRSFTKNGLKSVK